ncbi:MAG: hypothetical protein P8Y92_09390, partial [Halioglobus sp.]
GNRNLQTILNLQGGSGLSGPQVADLREAALADDGGEAIARLAAQLADAGAGSPGPAAAPSGTAVTRASA